MDQEVSAVVEAGNKRAVDVAVPNTAEEQDTAARSVVVADSAVACHRTSLEEVVDSAVGFHRVSRAVARNTAAVQVGRAQAGEAERDDQVLEQMEVQDDQVVAREAQADRVREQVESQDNQA